VSDLCGFLHSHNETVRELDTYVANLDTLLKPLQPYQHIRIRSSIRSILNQMSQQQFALPPLVDWLVAEVRELAQGEQLSV